jgi:hypothetical protein
MLHACLSNPRSAPKARNSRIHIFLQINGVIGTIGITVPASTEKTLKRAVAKQLEAWGLPHVSFCIHHGSKVLSGDSSTLVDLGIVSGSTIQVNFYDRRGGGGNSKFILSDDLREMIKQTPSGRLGKYSITRDGLTKIFPLLLRKARDDRGFEKKDLTSHDCAALFKGKSWKDGRWTDEKDPKLQFHPMEEFPELFSATWPDRMISYTWAEFTLINALSRFLAECEALVPPSTNGETTYWLDILANDQNSPDILLYLAIADGFYSGAELHFGFLFGGMLTRAWCNHEVVTRFRAGLKAEGLWVEGQEDNTHAVIRGGELLREGSPAFTIFVAVDSLTDLERDLINDGIGVRGSVDRFGTMQAFAAEDRREIQERARRTFGSPEAYNFMMTVVRNAVILSNADRRSVRPAAPAHHAGRCGPPAAARRREMSRREKS